MYQTLDAALLDFWETEATMQTHQELEKLATQAFCTMDAALLDFWSLEVSLTRNVSGSVNDNSFPLIAASCLQVPMATVTDLVPATKTGTCDLKYCTPTDDNRNSQATLVDDTDQNGEKAMVLYLVPPSFVRVPLPPPQPPPYHVTTSLSKHENNLPRETGE